MKLSPVTFAGALLAVLVSAPEARAELIHWMYTWSRSPSQINADAPGTGYIQLTDEGLKSASGDSDIVATNLRTSSTATTVPDKFTAAPYTLSLYLFDVSSGQSNTLNFTGQLDGTLTAQSANIKNTFTGLTTQEVVLGTNLYVVTIGPYSPPGPTASNNLGAISAHASITVESLMLPEPSALALSFLGLTAVGMARMRRRLRAR